MKITIKNKSDQVADQIIKMVIDGELKPGDRVPTETVLGEMFGVSRITIREAFKKLSVMGIMDVRQGEGTFVNTIPATYYMKPLLPLLILDKRDMEQLYDARLAIEVGLASLATKNRTEQDIEKLWTTLDIMKENFHIKDDTNRKLYAGADKEFHNLICRMSQNPYLISIYATLSDILDACIQKTSFYPSGREASMVEHNEIIKAISSGDRELSESLAKQHVLNAKEFYTEFNKLQQALNP